MSKDFYADDEEIEMPTPCQKCGDIFDLCEGVASEKWFPNTVICQDCGEEEDKEIENDSEIEDLIIIIKDATFDIKEWFIRLESFDFDATELLKEVKTEINNL